MPFTTDRLQYAAHTASQHLAFHLNQSFGQREDVHVFHSLWLTSSDELLPIDHLIFYRSGFIIIESRSVISAVRIDRNDEWIRRWNGDWKKIPSPLRQSQQQLEALVEFRRKNQLEDLNFDVVVAVSEQGSIYSREHLTNVHNAIQVTDTLKAMIEKRQQIPISKEENVIKLEAFRSFSALLLQNHQTLAPSESQDIPYKAVQCSSCSGSRLEVKFGKDYYLKCLECQNNTFIQLNCHVCQSKQMIKKNGRQFHAECHHCRTSHIYFINPPLS